MESCSYPKDDLSDAYCPLMAGQKQSERYVYISYPVEHLINTLVKLGISPVWNQFHNIKSGNVCKKI